MARPRIRAALAVVLATIFSIGCTPADPVPTPRPSGASVTDGPLGGQPTATTAPGTAGTTAPPPSGDVPESGTWALLEVGGPVPGAREDQTWTVGEEGSIYLFGGRDGSKVFGDVWRFDPAAGTWTRDRGQQGVAPAPRFGHEAAWVPGLGLVVWAGQAGATFFDDLWVYEPDGGTWRELPSGGNAPVARYGSCSGIGPDGRLWISHGFTEDGTRFADTRAYDFATGAWVDETPAGDGPFERCLHACWWTADGRFALYGGQTTGTPALGDLWFLAPGADDAATSTWTEAPAPEPAARNLAAVARRDPLTVMFGGRGLDGEPLDDTWLFADGGPGFVPLDTGAQAPPARSAAAMVYDAAGERFLLFGGVGDDAFDDVWELTFP
jgi:hypothetical protein